MLIETLNDDDTWVRYSKYAAAVAISLQCTGQIRVMKPKIDQRTAFGPIVSTKKSRNRKLRVMCSAVLTNGDFYFVFFLRLTSWIHRDRSVDVVTTPLDRYHNEYNMLCILCTWTYILYVIFTCLCANVYTYDCMRIIFKLWKWNIFIFFYLLLALFHVWNAHFCIITVTQDRSFCRIIFVAFFFFLNIYFLFFIYLTSKSFWLL